MPFEVDKDTIIGCLVGLLIGVVTYCRIKAVFRLGLGIAMLYFTFFDDNLSIQEAYAKLEDRVIRSRKLINCFIGGYLIGHGLRVHKVPGIDTVLHAVKLK